MAGLNLRLEFTQGITGMGVGGYKEIVHGQEGIVTHSEGGRQGLPRLTRLGKNFFQITARGAPEL